MTDKISLEKLLRIDEKRERVNKIQALMSESDFWEDYQSANIMAQELRHLTDFLQKFDEAESAEDLAELEGELFYRGRYDNNNVYLSIHAGSGGIEAMDWVEMLERMYLRYAQTQSWQFNLIDRSPGETAGVKSVTMLIKGFRAYGRLKGENGVHRLVRISPFDADKSRHTSFALVEILPEIDQSEISIKDEDLKIEVFRSGGHGGQSVNTTDSAVRITHIPTGLSTTCQNERSQHSNKQIALKHLIAKLHLLQLEKKRQTEKELKGIPIQASWGNQIRSYVLHPYQLVKDLRTDYETAKVEDVLDGGLDQLIDSYLKYQVSVN